MSGPQVRASRPAPMSIWWLRFDDQVASSLWFLPTCTAVVAYAVSRSLLALDGHLDLSSAPALLPESDPETMATVAATATAGMLTFLAVVFSTTLVAVQLASSQYSPRVVRVFVRSRVTQAALAVFLSTFVVSLNALAGSGAARSVRAPVLTLTLMYVLLLATVAMFVVFFHRIVRLLRVQYLFLSISKEAHDVLDAELPIAAATVAAEAPTPDPDPQVLRHSGRPSSIQAADLAGLASMAARTGDRTWIEMHVRVGDHLGWGVRIASVHHGDETVTSSIERHLVTGGERTQRQDTAFGIRQLVDAASRALSPAVNDPTTAVQAIHRMTDLLARVVGRPDPTPWFTDTDDVVRVWMDQDGFERLAVLAFTEVTRYGADAPQVVRALRAAYAHLDDLAAAEHRAAIGRLSDLLDEAVDDAMPAPYRAVSSRPDPLGLG